MKENIDALIEEKCSLCYRKGAEVDGCMLYSSKHKAIELCLGPFLNEKDRKERIEEDHKSFRRKVRVDRAVNEAVGAIYWRKARLFHKRYKK
jgi:ribosomal protein S10